MPLPTPEPGLVISFAYLWHEQYRRGIEEGNKDRPCVIVLAVAGAAVDDTEVMVLPITHSRPGSNDSAVEIPLRVKRHLGLDDQPSWVLLDEGNAFLWPGFDLRPIPGHADRFDYGLLPPKLFEEIKRRFLEVWSRGTGRAVPR